MTINCPSCIYYNASDQTCRRTAPPPLATQQSGNLTVAWPVVKATDWCAEGYNYTDGPYDRFPTPKP